MSVASTTDADELFETVQPRMPESVVTPADVPLDEDLAPLAEVDPVENVEHEPEPETETDSLEEAAIEDAEEWDLGLGITVSIRQLIGAGIILGLGVVILNQVFTMEMLQNSSGPFSVSTVTDPLGAALGIMGLALFVGGARVIMNQMGGGGGRGGL